MAGGITVGLAGIKELETSLDALDSDEFLDVIARELHRSGEDVMGDSKENYVPVMDGALRNSGHVSEPERIPDGVRVEIGFGGPAASYALAVHENPRAGKTGGVSPSGQKYRKWAKVGQWKYLETPLKKATPQIEKNLHAVIESYLSTKEKR